MAAGAVLLEYETVETSHANARAGGDITGWTTFEEDGCDEANADAARSGPAADDSSDTDGMLAVRVLRSSHDWTRDSPFSVRLGHDRDGTAFAVPSDSRLRIDFTHVLAGVIDMGGGTADWVPADQWPAAVEALADRQDCERRHRSSQYETAICREWQTADLRTFEADGPVQD